MIKVAELFSDVSRVSEIFIKVGTNYKNDPRVDLLPVSQIIMHPKYEATNFVKNMALIKIEPPIKFTNLVRPICLPNEKLDYKTLRSYRHCVASGFGNIDRGIPIFFSLNPYFVPCKCFQYFFKNEQNPCF